VRFLELFRKKRKEPDPRKDGEIEPGEEGMKDEQEAPVESREGPGLSGTGGAETRADTG